MDEICKTCGTTIQVMAFRGTGYCSVDCKKAAGIDHATQGTLTFLTREEAAMIKENRNGK